MPYKMAIVKSGALRRLNRLINAKDGATSKEVQKTASEVMQALGAVLTPTSRRALVQAVMMPPTGVDSIESRAARRAAGGRAGAATAWPRRSSPLAMMQSAREDVGGSPLAVMQS